METDMNDTHLQNRVMVVRCPNYDRDRIQKIITSGMKEFKFQPSGKIFLKPNVVFASKNGRPDDRYRYRSRIAL